MDRASRIAWAVVLGGVAMAGCSKGTSSDAPAADSGNGIVINNAVDPATNPIAKVAAEFLDAVLKGDTQRTTAMLTPRAIEQIAASKTEFRPQGLDNATFKIGEVRTPTESQAIVQCVLTQSSADGQSRIEEMCCLLRLVDNQWRVSGIAASNGPNRAPMILDFENTSPNPQLQQPMAGAQGQGTTPPSAGRPSPPRTAQEPSQSPSRY
jgi:hypothetical protein